MIYIYLTVAMGGIAIYALSQFMFLFFSLKQKGILLPLVFSCAALVYILTDISGFMFQGHIPAGRGINYFILIRENCELLFVVLLQFYIGSITIDNSLIRKTNHVMLYAAVIIVLVSAAAAFADPALFLKKNASSYDNLYTTHIRVREARPLLVLKNIVIILYGLYAVIVILVHGFKKHDDEPAEFIMAGMLIIMYFLSFYLYFLLFDPVNFPVRLRLPFFSMGLSACLVLITWGRLRIITENYAGMEEEKAVLEFSIYNDLALNIPGRHAFRKDLADELAGIHAGSGIMFIVFLDIDDFGSLNECYGESAGNDILRMLADRISDLFSTSGSLYRIGGDEFAFVLWNTKSRDDASDIAGKIISCLRNPFTSGGIDFMITASAGLLQLPGHGSDPDSVLSNAYRAIGLAKKTKNTFTIFTEDLLDITSRKIHYVNVLRNSILKNEFTLYYQPIVDRDRRIVHAEALLRFTGSENSVGGPGDFIPLLEDSGLMKEIDNMVIQIAFRDMESRIKGRFGVSINLSTAQIVNTSYSGFLSSYAEQHGIEKRGIVFEVTEERLIENIVSGRENIGRLKSAGFKVALDDFGKGFSSLTYLAELPVDIIKMDIAFAQNVPGDPRRDEIARYIIELAHSIGLKVVVEGIETEQQAEFFKSLGCDFFQGYYFSVPMPLDELIDKYC